MRRQTGHNHCPLGQAILMAWGNKRSRASLPSHPFGSPALPEPPWQGTHKRKEFVPTAAWVQGQSDPKQPMRSRFCFLQRGPPFALLCFVEKQTHIHAITASGGSQKTFYTSMVYPSTKLNGHQNNRCDVRYAAAIIDQLQLLFRYVCVSFGHQHQSMKGRP